MNEANGKPVFDVAYQPQVRTAVSTTRIMLTVVIALLPEIAVCFLQYGVYPLLIIAVSVASCVFFEWSYRKLMRKSCTVGDLSAVVTGILMVMTLPPNVPLWLPIVGAFFAIVVVKQLYGGIGKNFLNPALAGRAFLQASYALAMGLYNTPKGLTGAVDATTMATPLSYLYGGMELPDYFTKLNLFIGNRPGSMGDLSIVAVLIGAAILLGFRIINWRIPTATVGTVAVLTLIFGKSGYGNFDWMVYNLLSGGLMMGAFFMATDYATSPVTNSGKLIYGCGIGALIVLIRYFGGYPDGVSYAILIMNLCSWALDKAFRRRPFGSVDEVLAAVKEAVK